MRSEWRQNGVTRGNVWFYSWGNGIILGGDLVDKLGYKEVHNHEKYDCILWVGL